MALLEVGILREGSLVLWHEYFSLATIVTVGNNPPKALMPTERGRIYQGGHADRQFLPSVMSDSAPGRFDIMIDDASHLGEFWHLNANHHKPGGAYVIEDWGAGYFDELAGR